MLVLGLAGSPRRKSNSTHLLTTMLDRFADQGARTELIDVCKRHVEPCKEYVVCEKKGFCPINDDMASDIYERLWEADIVILSTPIFFYHMTAQLKALVDRCQTMWARKYRLRLTDPGRPSRQGYWLATAATRGRQLEDGLKLTMTYFLDAIGAKDAGGIMFRDIESPKDLKRHPTALADVQTAADTLMAPLSQRKRILFACRENACRSQMAGAFARYLGSEKWDVAIAGSEPAERINPLMVKMMAAKGIDMAFRTPRALDQAIEAHRPEIIITMGCGEKCPVVPGARVIDWDLPDPADQTEAVMQSVRDEIEGRVKELLGLK